MSTYIASSSSVKSKCLGKRLLDIAAIGNGGSDSLELATGAADVLRQSSHLTVVWSSAGCPSSAHAIGSAIAQLRQRMFEEEERKEEYGSPDGAKKMREDSDDSGSMKNSASISIDDDGRILMKKRHVTSLQGKMEAPAAPEQLVSLYHSYIDLLSTLKSGKAQSFRRSTGLRKTICFIYEAAERFHPTVLVETLRTLADLCQHIPVVVIMCLASSSNAIPALLPSTLAERLAIKSFMLHTARERLGKLVERKLISHDIPSLILGKNVCALLDEFIVHYDYSAFALQRVLHVSTLLHFGTKTSFRRNLDLLSTKVQSVDKCAVELSRMPRDIFENLVTCSGKKMTTELDLAKEIHFEWKQFNRDWKIWTTAIKLVHACLINSGKVNSETVNRYPLWRLWALASQITKEDLSRTYSDDGHKDVKRIQMQSVISEVVGFVRSLDENALMNILLVWRKELNYVKDMHTLAERINKKLNEVAKSKNSRERSEQDMHIQEPKAQYCAPPKTSANPIVIKSTGSNARRRRELLHRHVENVASEGGQQFSLQVAGRSTNENSLNHWVSREVLNLCQLLVSPVHSYPMMRKLFCFDDASEVRNILLPDPRTSVFKALSCPSSVLNCNCCPREEGRLKKTMEDACIAYGLMNEQGESYDMYDWYLAFRKVYGEKDITGMVRKTSRCSLPGRSNKDIQARFTRALGELHLLGIIRAKRRCMRSDKIQRLIFASAF